MFENKMEFLRAVVRPSAEKNHVFQKGSTFALEVDRCVESRLNRLRSLTEKLHRKPMPSFVSNCSCIAITAAYQVMFADVSGLARRKQVKLIARSMRSWFLQRVVGSHERLLSQ
jgi:hypothetical protein